MGGRFRPWPLSGGSGRWILAAEGVRGPAKMGFRRAQGRKKNIAKSIR